MYKRFLEKMGFWIEIEVESIYLDRQRRGHPLFPCPGHPPIQKKTTHVIWRVKRMHQRYWKRLALSETGDPVANHLPIMDRLKGDMARWMLVFRV